MPRKNIVGWIVTSAAAVFGLVMIVLASERSAAHPPGDYLLSTSTTPRNSAIEPYSATSTLLLPAAIGDRSFLRRAGAVRVRTVTVSYDYLQSHILPLGPSNDSERLQRAQQLSEVVRIDLFEDVASTFYRTQVRQVRPGFYSWVGRGTVSEFDNAVLLIEQDGDITGSLEIGGSRFLIDPIGGALHQVTEIDPRSMPPLH